MKAIQVYREVGYPYLLMPDHVPAAPDDPGGLQSFAFCYGYIRGLISQGLTKKQIERQLVAQYGPAVLGKPPAHGFNLTVYVLPPLKPISTPFWSLKTDFPRFRTLSWSECE